MCMPLNWHRLNRKQRVSCVIGIKKSKRVFTRWSLVFVRRDRRRNIGSHHTNDISTTVCSEHQPNPSISEHTIFAIHTRSHIYPAEYHGTAITFKTIYIGVVWVMDCHIGRCVIIDFSLNVHYRRECRHTCTRTHAPYINRTQFGNGPKYNKVQWIHWWDLSFNCADRSDLFCFSPFGDGSFVDLIAKTNTTNSA